MTGFTAEPVSSRRARADDGGMDTKLPVSGWMPDPVRPGLLRLRRAGIWTDAVMGGQEPWGPERMLPPAQLSPLHAMAS